MTTFNRTTALPRGHKLYTSSKTLAAWGAGGPRALMAANDDYSSRGQAVSWPAVAGDWTTCLPAAAASEHREPQQPKQFWLDGRLCRFPKSITGGKWERPVGTAPANDNTPRRNVVRLPNDGPTPEWLAERNAAGMATKYGSEGNRIERALVAEKSPLVATLRRVTELMRPPVIAANDNNPSAEEGEQSNSGKGHERIHNQGSITPSVPMLLKAYEDGVKSGVREVHDGWHRIGPTDGKRKLTGLIFLNGELIAYGDGRGRKRRPDYNTKVAEAVVEEESETAKHVAAQPDENRSYIRLAGRERYVSSQRPDAPSSIAPAQRTARAAANDNELRAAIANTKVMPAIKKLPDGVAADYGRLAGIAETKGVGEGKSSAPMHDALSELEREEKLTAAGLNDGDMAVVDSILSDASFRTVGLQRGYAESSAHRMGRKLVEDVLTRIAEKIAS